MDQQQAEARGIPTRYVEAFVAAALLLLGVVIVFESQRLGAGWTSDGPGSGYFPFYIGVIIALSAAGILYQALHAKKDQSGEEPIFVDGEQLKRVLSVLLPATVYVLGIALLGVYLASAVYIALFMIILGKYSPVKSALLGVAVNAVFFMMFEVWFKVPLFKGSLDPLSFLGY